MSLSRGVTSILGPHKVNSAVDLVTPWSLRCHWDIDTIVSNLINCVNIVDLNIHHRIGTISLSHSILWLGVFSHNARVGG